MENNECVMCAIFRNPRSRDRRLRHKKTSKNGNFGLKLYEFTCNSKTIWRTKLKFVRNVGAYKWLVQTEFGGARLRGQNVTGQKFAESERFWTNIFR